MYDAALDGAVRTLGPTSGQRKFLIRDVPVSSARPDVLWFARIVAIWRVGTLLLHGGTDSSNLLSSSGESVANFRRVPSRFVLECGTSLYGYSPAVHVDFRPYYLGRLMVDLEQRLRPRQAPGMRCQNASVTSLHGIRPSQIANPVLGRAVRQ